MTGKISPRLDGLLRLASKEREVALNLLMKQGMSPSQISKAMELIRGVAITPTDVEFIPITSSMHCRVPLSQLDSIVKMSDVESIDIERDVPIEELLDG